MLILMIFLPSFAPEAMAEEMVSVRLKNYIGNTSHLSVRVKGDYVTLDPTLKLNEGEKYKLSLKRGKLFLKHGKSKKKIDGSILVGIKAANIVLFGQITIVG